jgi:hypothetical protein
MADNCGCAGVLRASELFVLDNLRSCLAGYDLGETACWEFNYQSAFVRVGADHAKLLVPELHLWALLLRQNSPRGLSYFPRFCRHVCRDEFLALAALSSAQNEEDDIAALALHHLMADEHSTRHVDLWRQTQRCAAQFAAADILLRPMPLEAVIIAGRFGGVSSSPPPVLN